MPQSPQPILKRIALTLNHSHCRESHRDKLWEQPPCGSSPGGVVCNSTAANARIKWGWVGITWRSGKGTVADFCWPIFQHSNYQKWSLLTPCWPLQDQIISMQMPHGKGALSLHAEVTETGDLGDPVPTSTGMLLAWFARWDGAGALEMAVSSGAAPSHLASRARSVSSWQCGCGCLTAAVTWSLVPSLQQFSSWDGNKSPEAVLACSALLPSPMQEVCPGLQLSRCCLQSRCCKKCSLCCSASPCWWHQLQSALLY